MAVNMCRPGGLWLVGPYETRRVGSRCAPLRLIMHSPLLLPALPYLDIGIAVYRSCVSTAQVRKGARRGARGRPVSSSVPGRTPHFPCLSVVA
eukprot:399644-Pyramimonas_sp.AAC.1